MRARTNKAKGAQAGTANSIAERVLDVLLAFNEDKPTWTVAELAEHFRMPKTTAYRYVNSLRGYGLLIENQAGGYRLGPRFFPLARIAKRGTSIIEIATPYLTELNERFNETVILNELLGYEVVALIRMAARRPVTITVSRGQILPNPASSSSQVLFAFMPEAEREKLLKMIEPVRYTAKTETDVNAIRKKLDVIRRDGYAFNDEGLDEGVSAIAVPVLVGGSVKHTISIAAPSYRIRDDNFSEMLAALKRAAGYIGDQVSQMEL